MNSFQDLIIRRRSIRKYGEARLSEDAVRKLLEAALLAPTSKNARSWHFTVVDDKERLEALSKCKPMYATSIARSALSIVVSADPAVSDVWVEDASVAAAYIQLQAEDLGLGSCWIQVRNRMHDEETTASEWIKDLLGIDGSQQVVCVISVGEKAEERKLQNMEKLQWEKVSVVSD